MPDPAEPPPTLAQQIAEVERMIVHSDAVARGLGMHGRTRDDAKKQHRTRVLRAVLDTLRAVEAGEAGEPHA